MLLKKELKTAAAFSNLFGLVTKKSITFTKLLRVGGLDPASVAMHYPFSLPAEQDVGLVGNIFLCFLFAKKYKSDPPLQFFFSLQFRKKNTAYRSKFFNVICTSPKSK